MDEMPTKYLISKGNASMGTGNEIQLECYEYDVSKGEDGWYLAECEELHAITQGKNWEELKDNILEVHSLMLDYND